MDTNPHEGSAQVPYLCPDCGADGRATLNEWPTGDEEIVRVGTSFKCGCGAALELDDVGPTTGETRTALLDRDGEWKLEPSNDASRKAAVLRLKSVLKWTQEEAAMALKSGTLYRGTKGECESLADYLERHGSHSVAKPV